MRAFIIGNGPSLAVTPLHLLKGEVTWAVNRIWKIFDQTDWRPTHYVRGEIPEYNPDHVREDIARMIQEPSRLWLQEGFRGDFSRKALLQKGCEYFVTCTGKHNPEWHLPLICGIGTSLHIAMQLAIKEGATELYLVGCDLGMPNHFYGNEGLPNDEKAGGAHKVAARCSPVPIFNATIGGSLEVYRRVDLWRLTTQEKARATHTR